MLLFLLLLNDIFVVDRYVCRSTASDVLAMDRIAVRADTRQPFTDNNDDNNTNDDDDDNEEDRAVSLSDVLVVGVCADWQLRVWSTARRVCVRSTMMFVCCCAVVSLT
jgi:hypothetical protein